MAGAFQNSAFQNSGYQTDHGSVIRGGGAVDEDRKRKRRHERAFVRLPDGQLHEVPAQQATDSAIWAKNYIEARKRELLREQADNDELAHALLYLMMIDED